MATSRRILVVAGVRVLAPARAVVVQAGQKTVPAFPAVVIAEDALAFRSRVARIGLRHAGTWDVGHLGLSGLSRLLAHQRGGLLAGLIQVDGHRLLRLA